jgi:hypothetical protein
MSTQYVVVIAVTLPFDISIRGEAFSWIRAGWVRWVSSKGSESPFSILYLSRSAGTSLKRGSEGILKSP